MTYIVCLSPCLSMRRCYIMHRGKLTHSGDFRYICGIINSVDFFKSLLFSIGFVCIFPFPRIQKTAICCNLSKYIAIFSNRKNYLATQCLPIDS